jgi:hypothetical protein
MSQINVDTVVPFSGATVTVNGVVTRKNLNTIQLSTTNNVIAAPNSTIIGATAGLNATGSSLVAVGTQAGYSMTTGIGNVFVGAGAGFSLTTANGTVCLGNVAGNNITTGSGNTCIGNGAGSTVSTGSSNTFLGDGAGTGFNPLTGQNLIVIQGNPSSAIVSNEITLGNAFIGTLRCAVSSITALSDARDKKDITDLRAGLDFVKALRPVEFVWDDRSEEGKRGVIDSGFLAQDLKAAQEDADMADALKLVYESNPEKLEASYGRLIPVLVKAIQELTAKVETLENKKK